VNWIRTVVVLVPLIAIYTIVIGAVSLVGGLFDSSGRFSHRCAQVWARLILWTSGVRIELEGAALPPVDQSCVFVANHSSFYDTPIVFTALPRQLRIMAKAALGYVPFLGWHLRRGGHVLVNRRNPGASIFKRMQRMAKSGASLVVFPEGSRTIDGNLQKFKAGMFLLAIENGLPVVPITISGSRIVMPKGRFSVSPAIVTVTVHEQIATKDLAREDARSLAAKVQDIIASAVNSHVAHG
jgi:1-acyl-sn-glycerol-3-phosphate acyltransferase